MQLIKGGRRFGKTRALIEWAKAAKGDERRIIVVATDADRKAIHQIDPKIEVCPIRKLRATLPMSARGPRISFAIDDLDQILPFWFREHFGLEGNVDMATLTEWDLDTLPRPPFGPSPAMATKPIVDADKAADDENRKRNGF